MSVIHTKANMVVAHEPEPGDRFVRITWHGPAQDGPYATGFVGPLWPVERYQSCVDWALSMADFMRYPIYVEPVHPNELRKRKVTRQ